MTKRLLLLNGLAALAVVMNHASAWGFTAMFWWVDRYMQVSAPDFSQLGNSAYYGLRVIEQYIIFTIPAFLTVSGFFVAMSTGRDQHTIRWQVVLARVRRLLIPFTIWSLLIMGLSLLQGQRFTAIGFITTFLTGRAAPPFYYIPMLVQFFLISPLLVPLARDRWKSLLLFAVVLQVYVLSLNYALILDIDTASLGPLQFLHHGWLFTSQIFWFCLGMVAGFHLPEFKLFLRRFRWVFLSMTIIFFIGGIFEWEYLVQISGQAWIGPRETIIDQLYALGFIFSFLAFDEIILPLSTQLSNIGRKSFGIYLAHTPALEYTARAIYHISPSILAFQGIFLPILITMGLGFPLVLMALVNRSPARRIYEHLFG